MAHRRVTSVGTAPVSVPRASRPWWPAAVLIFAASRVVSTLLLLWVQTQATPLSRQGATPSFLDLTTAWDGTWYWYIADNGYPTVLPVTAAGTVDTNQWAFLPVYPYLVKLLTFGVLDWRLAAVLVSTAAGFAAALLLGALLLPRIGRAKALFAVAVFSFSPLAFLLQIAYAESLGLALLLAALLLIDRRRYGAAIAPAVLLAFTRPGVLALALAVGVQLLVRLARARRGGEPLPPAQLRDGVLLVAVSVVSGFAWSGIAAVVTGRPDAYFATEGAWRALWMPDSDIVLFEPWWFAAEFWAGRWAGDAAAPFLAPVLLVLVVGGLVVALLSPPIRRLGSTVVLWSAAYALYLLAVFFPQSSVFRLLMPMAPLAGAVTPARRTPRVVVLVICIGLQVLWAWVVLGPRQDYWTVP